MTKRIKVADLPEFDGAHYNLVLFVESKGKGSVLPANSPDPEPKNHFAPQIKKEVFAKWLQKWLQ